MGVKCLEQWLAQSKQALKQCIFLTLYTHKVCPRSLALGAIRRAYFHI